MRDCCQEQPTARLIEGIAQFNRGEFFDQHETLEDLWRAEARDIRYLYQGILQVGVAFYHIQRNNHHGAVYMLTRGSDYLRPFAPACQSVDVARLITDAAVVLDAVRRLGKQNLGQFDWALVPRIRLVPPSFRAG